MIQTQFQDLLLPRPSFLSRIIFISQEGGKGQIDSKVEEVDEVNYDTISGEESLAGPSLMGCPPPPLWC